MTDWITAWDAHRQSRDEQPSKGYQWIDDIARIWGVSDITARARLLQMHKDGAVLRELRKRNGKNTWTYSISKKGSGRA